MVRRKGLHPPTARHKRELRVMETNFAIFLIFITFHSCARVKVSRREKNPTKRQNQSAFKVFPAILEQYFPVSLPASLLTNLPSLPPSPHGVCFSHIAPNGGARIFSIPLMPQSAIKIIINSGRIFQMLLPRPDVVSFFLAFRRTITVHFTW